jgi:hypothetical protein
VENLIIDSGIKRIRINEDDNRIIEFNPEDIVFVEKFYGLIKKFEEKEADFRLKTEEIGSIEGEDEYGIPLNTKQTLDLILDLCNYLRKEIDEVFGEDTSNKAFGQTQTLNMFEQFFNGIVPFVQKTRNERIEKYYSK